MPNDSAVEGLRNIIATGTEEQAMQYIQDNLKEFPKELQQRIVLGLFIDAAKSDLAERMAVADIKSQVLSLLQEFDALEKAGK